MFAKFEIEHFVEQKGDKMQLNGRQSAIVEFLKTEKRASVKKMADYVVPDLRGLLEYLR